MSENKTMTALDRNDPLMIAWEKYKSTEDYANTRKWALHEAHVDGSLWAAFLEGYITSKSAKTQEPNNVGDEELIEKICIAIADNAWGKGNYRGRDLYSIKPAAKAALSTIRQHLSDQAMKED